ncbi:MAG: hypothetical protein ACJ79C_11335, partial [Myxococcales bacterium]
TPDFFATVSAFVFQAGVFTDVSPAAAAGFSELNAISQAGDAVGDFFDADGFDRGFLRTAAGAITVLPDPVPGVAANAPFGINSRGTIVGTYTIAATSSAPGSMPPTSATASSSPGTTTTRIAAAV